VVSPLVPASVGDIAARVEQRIAELLDGERKRWTETDSDLELPLTTLREYILSGGKRLRPAFCYWSYVGAGGDPSNPVVIDAAAALEMLHTAALVHDDVIDASAQRHGADTVHVDYARRHSRNSWIGDERRFGAGVAILVGDLALIYSDGLMASAPHAAAAVFDEMRLEVNVGQYLDILGAAQGVDLPGDTAVQRAKRICRYKTAKYTVERPLHIGAAVAAPSSFDELAPPLSRFGLPLGEAFQLRDDLLDAFGDASVTGKPVGDDLREGKPTLLAALTAQRASGAGATLFKTRFGAPDLTDTEVGAMLEVVDSCGARAQVEDAIQALVSVASAALSDLPSIPQARAALGELVTFVAGRDH
jgi:geranylgeranyl diphosphate synthase, type I